MSAAPVTPQIEGLPPGAVVTPIQSQGIEGLPPGAVVTPLQPAQQQVPPSEKSSLSKLWDFASKGLISGDTILNTVKKLSPGLPDQKPGESGRDYFTRIQNKVDMDHPYLQGMAAGIAGAFKDTADTASSFTSPVSIGLAGAGAAGKIPGAVGKVAKAVTGLSGAGFAAKGGADVASNAPAAVQGDPEAAQRALMGGAMVAGGAAAMGDTAKVANAEHTKFATGPVVRTMADAAKLPPNVVLGTEDIIRAAAPTGMNQGFRANTYAAAGDLAEIGRKLDLDKSSGGMLRPDMRVRATVNAIDEHLKEMDAQERAPQIQKNANLPVKIGTNPDAVRGLEYLEKSAGKVEDANLAKKALEERTLTVAETDRLRVVANETLRSFERMTPEGKFQATTANPRVGGLKAIDQDISNNLNSVLKDSGDSGLRSYERRYAALSEIKAQLQSRMNATELQRSVSFPGSEVVKGVIKGKSGIASASQAAVADVNIGRSLQRGFNRLKGTPIVPDR